MIPLDFNPECCILGLSLAPGRTGNFLTGATVPRCRGLVPVNESYSQFEQESVNRSTVSFAGLRAVTGQKLTACKYADSQGWQNPRNGWHDATLYADAEVNEKNKPYLTIRQKDRPFSDSQRMAVCL